MPVINTTTVPGKIVWGIPAKILSVMCALPGRQRLSFRHRREGRIYFKTPEGIRQFVLSEVDGVWVPIIEQGRNLRP